MTPARLETEGVSVDLGGRRIVHDVTLIAEPGEVIGVVGPNGCGKSTLLRAVVRVLTPSAGRILVDGADVTAMSIRDLARSVAAVLQDTTGDFDLSVHEVVAMGRAPFKRMFARDDASDEEIIHSSLERVGAAHLVHRQFALMSGGERQRVLIARALAQRPRLLVLDEPTNHLDIRHQFDTLALPAALGITAVVALHDLNLAAHYCDRIHVLQAGRVVAGGAPADVLTPELLDEVYGVAAQVGPHPRSGRTQVSFDPGAPMGPRPKMESPRMESPRIKGR